MVRADLRRAILDVLMHLVVFNTRIIKQIMDLVQIMDTIMVLTCIIVTRLVDIPVHTMVPLISMVVLINSLKDTLYGVILYRGK